MSKRLLLSLLLLCMVASGAWAQQTFSLQYEGLGMDSVLVRVMVDTVSPQSSFSGASVWLAYDTSVLAYQSVTYAGGLFGVWDFNWIYDKVDEGVGNTNYAGTSTSGSFLAGPGVGFYLKYGIKAPYDINSFDNWITVCSTRVDPGAKVHSYHPDVPALFSPANGSDVYTTTPTFDWQETCGPHGSYTIEYSTTWNFSANVVTVTGIATDQWTPPTSLAPGMYYWRVQAFDVLARGSGYQTPPPDSFRILACSDVPEAPTGSADIVCVGENYCLTWDHAVNAAWYRISVDGGDWHNIGYVQTFCTDTLPVGVHEYRLQGCTSECGCSGASGAETVTVRAALSKPATPTSVPAVVNTDQLFCINWTLDPNAESYQIQENNGTWTPVGLTAQHCLTKAVAGLYYYRIRACNTICGCGEASDSVLVSVGGALPPPDSLLVNDDTVCTGVQFTLSWPAVVGATSYNYRFNGGGWQSVGNVLSVNVSQPTAGTYVYEVQACAAACSGPSPSVTVVVKTAPSKIEHSCDFDATQDEIELVWDAVSGATVYKIYHNGAIDTTVTATSVIRKVPAAGKHRYQVTVVNSCGEGPLSDTNCVVDQTDVWEIPGASLPQEYVLRQNYPNPFNPETYIEFALPKGSHTVLEIYNVLGRRVNTLVDEYLSAGEKVVVWDGTDLNGSVVSSGIYFYRIQAADYRATKKMVLMK
ncbi:MAG: T9SS type A sorting domain-containing protein [bacterium]